jgi:PKD repeat protein
MSKTLLLRSSLLVSLTIGGAACTVHPSGAAPDLAGPSSFGHSLTLTASPDSITADGSMSTVTATLIGPDGKPMAGVPLQLSMAVSQTPIDWGYLSSRTIYTDATGQGKVVYVSPVMTGFFAGTPGQDVSIVATPVGSNYATAVPVNARIRVTPPPVPILGADTPLAAVTYAPTSPKVGDNIVFDASGSQPAAGHSIVSYFWDFGDGRLNDEHGNDASHAYAAPGTYTMVLGVTDEAGHSGSTFKSIVVSK